MGTATIGVVIGLVLAYSLLSLIVSQINNLILYILKYRTSFLVNRMRAILPQIADEVLKNPLINVLDSDGSKNRVDTINPRHIVDVLLREFEEAQATEEGSMTQAPISDLLEQILGSKDFRNLRNMLKASKNLPASRQWLESLDQGVEAIEAVKAYEQLIKGKLDEGKTAIYSWVDARFTDMTNLYKQYIQILSLLVGLVLAVVLNVDSLYMAQTLWNEPALRTSVLESANQISQSELRPTSIEDDYNDQVASIQSTIETLMNANLPIGWVYVSLDKEEASAQSVDQMELAVYNPATDMRNVANVWALNWGFITIKIVGWLLTAFAVSLGTDFWFNLLRNVTGRSEPPDDQKA